MKFANKFELFETLTKGRVETFVAKYVANTESVLVHIFEAPGELAKQPTTQWIVESFATIAPMPPGRVIEAGVYEDDAYLVTNNPDFSSLRRWIRSYEAFGAESPENLTPQQRISIQNPVVSDRVSKPSDSTAVVRSPSGFRAKNPAPEPGEFTREFFGGSAQDSSKSMDVSAGQITDEPTQPAPGNFTALFQSTLKPATTPIPESMNAPVKSEASQAGEFTKFFRDPFDGDRPAETPVFSQPSDIKPAKPEGEFTRVFGSGKSHPFARPLNEGATGDDPLVPGSGAFRITEEANAGQPPANESLLKPSEAGPARIADSFTKTPAWTSPVAPPIQPPANPAMPPLVPGSTVSSTLRRGEFSTPENATRVFSNPGNDSALSPPPPPPGPSEYTRIISGGAVREMLSKESPSGSSGSQTPPGGNPALNIPVLPPALPTPTVPWPEPPKLQPPPLAPPSTPAIPKMTAEPPKGKVSYLLIIILNVLLILAILLIVYFAIKH